MLKNVAVALVLLAACKSKAKEPPPAVSGSGAGSGSGTTPAPTTPPATFSAKKIQMGCFAWSANEHAVACVVGSLSMSEAPEVSVRYFGTTESPQPITFESDGPPSTEPDPEPASVTAVNTTLAKHGFGALPNEVLKMQGDTFHLGDATLQWAHKQGSAGGENEPATSNDTITLTCKGKSTTLYTNDLAGVEATVTVHMVGGFAVIDIQRDVAGEGESSKVGESYLLDLSSCTLTPTPDAVPAGAAGSAH